MPRIISIPSWKLRKVFEKAGFKCVVIPDWNEVPVFIIKNNLRTAGLSREEYFALMDQA